MWTEGNTRSLPHSWCHLRFTSRHVVSILPHAAKWVSGFCVCRQLSFSAFTSRPLRLLQLDVLVIEQYLDVSLRQLCQNPFNSDCGSCVMSAVITGTGISTKTAVSDGCPDWLQDYLRFG